MQEVFEKIKERLEENKERYIKLQTAYCNPNKVYEFVGKEQAINIAIEIVNQVAEEYVEKTYKFGNSEQVINQSLTEINQSLTNGGWIPCSERLPKELGRYIVTLKDGRSLEAIYDNISKRFIMYEHDVIAWQPLPDPYKPEGE